MRHAILLPIAISTLVSCRSVPLEPSLVTRDGCERRAVTVRAARATELANTCNELLRSTKKSAREQTFESGACVLYPPRSFPDAQLEDFDAFQGDDRARVVWVTARPEEQALLAELIQRFDRE